MSDITALVLLFTQLLCASSQLGTRQSRKSSYISGNPVSHLSFGWKIGLAFGCGLGVAILYCICKNMPDEEEEEEEDIPKTLHFLYNTDTTYAPSHENGGPDGLGQIEQCIRSDIHTQDDVGLRDCLELEDASGGVYSEATV